MSSSRNVKACRLCLAMDVKLLEIEMGLKNSVKSMLGENVYYTSGLPSSVCFECAAQLRKYTKFRRKCRRVQTFLYGILKNNKEVTEEELNKIDRNNLGLESSLSTRAVVSILLGEPTEVIKQEVPDTDLDISVNDDVLVENDIDIKIEEPMIHETFDYQEQEELPLQADTNNSHTNKRWKWEVGDRGHEILEYMATLGTGPYLQEISSKNQNASENVRNEGKNFSTKNIKLSTCTINTGSSSQFIVCKKCLKVFRAAIFSEHKSHCEQDVNRETVSVLKNLGVSVFPVKNLEIKPSPKSNANLQVQSSDQRRNVVNLIQHDLNEPTEINKTLLHNNDKGKKVQGLNLLCKNKTTFGKQYINKKKGTNVKSNHHNNDLQQAQTEFTVNEIAQVSNVNNTENNLKQNSKKVGDVSISAHVKNPSNFTVNRNVDTIDINKYMKAIELLPLVTNNSVQDVSCKNKTKGKHVTKIAHPKSTIVKINKNYGHIKDIKQEIDDFAINEIDSACSLEMIGNDLTQLNKNIEDIRKVHNTNNLIVKTNIANIINMNTKFDKEIRRTFKKGSNVKFKTKLKGQDFRNGVVQTENQIVKSSNNGCKTKKKRNFLHNTDSDNGKSNKVSRQRKKVVHRRWTKEEMEIVCRRFHNELDLNQNPGVAKCKLVLEEEPLLNGRTWMQLNSCVNNLYMKKVKDRRKIATKLQNNAGIVPFHSHLSLPSQVLAMRIPSGESLH